MNPYRLDHHRSQTRINFARSAWLFASPQDRNKTVGARLRLLDFTLMPELSLSDR